MLLHNPAPLEARCPRRWSVLAAAGLLGLAVVGAGLGLGVHAAPAPASREEPKKEEPKKAEPKKEEPKKEEPKKEESKKEEPGHDLPGFPALPDIEEMLKRMPALDRRQLEHVRKQMEMQRKEMEKTMQLMPGLHRLPQEFPALPGFGRPMGQEQESRLGVHIDRPSATLVDQLDLPREQGVVIGQVMPNSPADKAGLKRHDILLELNGKPVPSKPEEVTKLVAGIKAGTPFDAVVLRKGKRETIKGLSLPEAREARDDPFGGFFPPAGNFLPPNLPAFPGAGAALMPNFGGAGAFAAAGGNGVMTTTFRSGDRFTTRHQEGSLIITVTGKVADGKSTVAEIRVQDGRESHKYESVDKVPDEYRDKVKNLIEMTGKSNVRIEIQN
jgi:hypothetical protein